MAFSLDTIFTTRTALPSNSGFVEIEPIAALRPYIRCFWTCDYGEIGLQTRIIPDCCADIIFDIANKGDAFIGVCSNSFLADNVGTFFGIRFYAWAVPRFVRSNATELFDFCTAPENIFNRFADFKAKIFVSKTDAQRVELSQKYLLRLLDERYDSDVMNCLYTIISKSGNISVNDLSDSVAVSRRTLERKFMQHIGMSPKTIAELIRYQLLWQDCIGNNFCISDEIDKFGYYDQAHMYNDFKKYHGIGLSEARREYRKLSRFYNTNT